MVLKVTGSNPVIHLAVFLVVDKVLKYLIFFKQFYGKYQDFFNDLIKALLTFCFCFLINMFICYKYIFVLFDFFIKLVGNNFIITYDSFTISHFMFWLAFSLTINLFLLFAFISFLFYSISFLYQEDLGICSCYVLLYCFFTFLFNYTFFNEFLHRRFLYNQGFQVNSFVSQNSIYLDNNLRDCFFFLVESLFLFNLFLILPFIFIFFKDKFFNFLFHFFFMYRLEFYLFFYIFNAFFLLTAKFVLLFLLFIIIFSELFYFYLLFLFLVERF